MRRLALILLLCVCACSRSKVQPMASIEALYANADSASWMAISDSLAQIYFDDAKTRDDSLYMRILQIEKKYCRFPAYYNRTQLWRKNAIELGAPGRRFPPVCPLNGTSLILVNTGDCEECRALEKKVSKTLSKEIASGRLNYQKINIAEIGISLDPRYVPSLYLVGADSLILVKGAKDPKIIKSKLKELSYGK